MGGAEASIDEAGRWPLSASQGVWIFSLLAGCFLALYFSFFGRTPSRVGATQGARILSLLAGCYPALYLCFFFIGPSLYSFSSFLSSFLPLSFYPPLSFSLSPLILLLRFLTIVPQQFSLSYVSLSPPLLFFLLFSLLCIFFSFFG